MAKTVLVLGGGVGGVVAANVLSKTLPKKHQVILVDRSDSHSMRSSYPLLLVNRRRPAQIIRKLEDLRGKRIQFIQAEVKQLDPINSRVETSAGPFSYDYLIIALGAEHHPETVPGLSAGAYNPWSLNEAEQLRKQLLRFKQGGIVFFLASLPYTGLIAPPETMFLLDSYFRSKGLRERVSLTMVTPEEAPFPLAPPQVGNTMRKEMKQRGIEFITQAKVLSLNPEKSRLVLDHGIEVPGDLFIGVPSHWGPSALTNSGLTENGGWITVDPYTLETSAESVFAVGDAAAVKLPLSKVWAPKAGIYAHYQAEVVARNIASMICGEKAHFRFTGKGGAVMATGLGQGRYLSVHYYRQPFPRFALYRSTRTAYWAKIAFEKYWLSRWF